MLQGRAVLPYLWGIRWGKAYGYKMSYKRCELHEACLVQLGARSAGCRYILVVQLIYWSVLHHGRCCLCGEISVAMSQ